MSKTKQQIQAYNKEYCARPDVIARAKVKNVLYREHRKLYKKTVTGRENENKYRRKAYSVKGFDRHLRQRYKITQADYDNLVLLQKGLCAICSGTQKGKLHVDHCHTTLKVRGLLCGSCNRALGLLKDDIGILSSAIKYLSK